MDISRSVSEGADVTSKKTFRGDALFHELRHVFLSQSVLSEVLLM